MPDVTDPTHPDFIWPGGGGVASKDEIALLAAHVKAWITRELEAVGINLAPAAAPVPEPVAEPVPEPAPPPEPPAADLIDANAGGEQASQTDAPPAAAEPAPAVSDPDAASG